MNCTATGMAKQADEEICFPPSEQHEYPSNGVQIMSPSPKYHRRVPKENES